jgi:hypothetical protein
MTLKRKRLIGASGALLIPAMSPPPPLPCLLLAHFPVPQVLPAGSRTCSLPNGFKLSGAFTVLLPLIFTAWSLARMRPRGFLLPEYLVKGRMYSTKACYPTCKLTRLVDIENLGIWSFDISGDLACAGHGESMKRAKLRVNTHRRRCR